MVTDTGDPRPEQVRLWIEVVGTVQGVGFRPFVYGLAHELQLAGFVRNIDGRVEVEAEGERAAVDELVRRLRDSAPLMARVEAVSVRKLPLDGLSGTETGRGTKHGREFVIRESNTVSNGGSIGGSIGGQRWFPPDIATCPDCVRELFDPGDRRYRYPFTNCTNCGPRATIIEDLPYDRDRTVMSLFPLCTECRREYENPADRRFHAEPIACPECGPQLAYRPGDTSPPSLMGEEALRAAIEDLREGRILAIKGLGGYQLACDARSEVAVERLRERKHRWAKPLAVMAPDLTAVRLMAEVSGPERELLTSTACPIVLLKSREDNPLASAVCAGNPRVGVFLPYTPLHHLLLREFGGPIVLTSGNLSDEPIAIDDEDALGRLGNIADGFLTHNREIRARYDDSVTRLVGDRLAIIRRARGYAPTPLPLPISTPQPLLATGAQLKHTFTLALGDRAWVGPHTGDLEDAGTFDAFNWNLRHLSRLQAIEPTHVAHDLHPSYLSTQYAEKNFPPERRIPVQHHHAHIAACMAEHKLTGDIIGVSFDGIGLGDDGTMWGGEILLANLQGYRRVARFAHAPMPGGAAAVRKPYRMACGYLFGAESFGDSDSGIQVDSALKAEFLRRFNSAEVEIIRTQVSRGLNSPTTSSAGRLFDAAASLLGLCDVASFEAQAAIELETAADLTEAGDLPWDLRETDGLLVFDSRRTLGSLMAGRAEGIDIGSLSSRFHNTIISATVELCSRVRETYGLSVVGLSGGVLQNQILAVRLPIALAAEGFEVYMGEEIPVNDGGISYGQAAVAAARLQVR